MEECKIQAYAKASLDIDHRVKLQDLFHLLLKYNTTRHTNEYINWDKTITLYSLLRWCGLLIFPLFLITFGKISNKNRRWVENRKCRSDWIYKLYRSTQQYRWSRNRCGNTVHWLLLQRKMNVLKWSLFWEFHFSIGIWQYLFDSSE